MDHLTVHPLQKRTKICKFFRKLTNISFFTQQTNNGHHINTKNGFPNQRKNTFNEITGVPESQSIYSVDDNLENRESTTSLDTAIQEFFPSLGSLPTPDFISVDGATEDIFHTPSMNSVLDGNVKSIESIQSMHSQDKKSDSFFSTLDKRDSRQASTVPSKSKLKCCCKCSVGRIVFFLLFIIAAIVCTYYVKTYGMPNFTKEKNSQLENEPMLNVEVEPEEDDQVYNSDVRTHDERKTENEPKKTLTDWR